MEPTCAHEQGYVGVGGRSGRSPPGGLRARSHYPPSIPSQLKASNKENGEASMESPQLWGLGYDASSNEAQGTPRPQRSGGQKGEAPPRARVGRRAIRGGKLGGTPHPANCQKGKAEAHRTGGPQVRVLPKSSERHLAIQEGV